MAITVMVTMTVIAIVIIFLKNTFCYKITTCGTGSWRSQTSLISDSKSQVLYRVLFLGQGVKEAVDARRLHHQLYPNQVQSPVNSPPSWWWASSWSRFSTSRGQPGGLLRVWRSLSPPPSEAPLFQEKKYKEYLTIFSEEDFFGKTPFFPMFEFSLQSFGHETKLFPVGGSIVQVTFVSWHHCVVFIFASCCHFWSGAYGWTSNRRHRCKCRLQERRRGRWILKIWWNNPVSLDWKAFP